MPLSKSKANPKPRVYEFEAIGTHWTIDIYDELSSEKSVGLQHAVKNRILEFDKVYSRFRTDSLVAKMARVAGKYELPKDARPLLDFYQHLYEVTDGAVTPLIGQTLADAGYDAKYSLKPKAVISKVPKWDEVMKYDFPYLELFRPALLDFGAAGKGYLVDIVGQLLEKYGVKAFCVDAGGDILYKGSSQPLAVGSEHPDNPAQAIGIVKLNNQSICGSAGNRRTWGKYHHIINPATLRSPQDINAVWVVANNAMLADGLTTALFFTSAKALSKHYTFEYVVVYKDGTLERSPKLNAEIFGE